MKQVMNETLLDIFIRKNLPKAMEAATMNSLGDRKDYIGSSDIGGCPRKAFLDKTRKVELDMSTLIRFGRGHISEGIVRQMLWGLNPKEQVELSIELEGFLTPAKAHLDFMFENQHECVVIEAKSVNSAILEPYDNWIMQVQYQLHLLKLVQQKHARAYIVAIDFNSGWFKSFEVLYNEIIAQKSIERASILANALHNNEEPEAEEQLYCSMCPHKGDCPLMNACAVELSGALKQLAMELSVFDKQKKELEKIVEAKKAELREFMETAKLKKVKADDSFFLLSSDSSYSSIDTKILKELEPDLYNQLLSKYGKEVSRKGYIQVK